MAEPRTAGTRGDTNRSTGRLLVILAGLSAIGPLSVDMYLPALPALSRDLSASASLTQLTVTACLIGLAAGQLLTGPLSDRWGRRTPLVVCTVLYVLGSALCAAAPSMALLIVARVLQGLAGSGGIAIARAIVRDMHEGAAAAKFFALLISVTALGPVLAPVIGGQLLHVTDWRGIFGVIAALGGVLVVAVLTGVRETLPPEARHGGGVRATVGVFGRLVADRRFTGYALAGGFAFAAMFAYIAGSPFVLQEHYGLSPQAFSLAFAVNGAGIVVAGQVSHRLAGRVDPHALQSAGHALASMGAALLLVSVLGGIGLWGVLPALFLVVASMGLVIPNSAALAMSGWPPSVAGSASALLGLVQFVIGATVSPLVGVAGPDTAVPMAIVIATLTAAAVAAFLSAGRASPLAPAADHPQPAPAVGSGARSSPDPEVPMGIDSSIPLDQRLVLERADWEDGPPYELFKQLRAECPVHWSARMSEFPEEAGYWSITTADDVHEVSRDWETYSSEKGGITAISNAIIPLELTRAMFIGMDPPKHDRIKALFQRGFTPKRIAEHEDEIRAITRDVLDRLEGRETADLVDDVAQPVVARVIGSFMGLPPEDDVVWAKLMNTILGAGDEDVNPEGVETVMARDVPEVFRRCTELIADRRANPTEDLTSVLVHAEIDGERLEEHEIVMGFFLLMAAGNDSTKATYCSAMRALMEHPDQRQLLLDDPSLVPSTVEEALRMFPAFAHFRRTATRDTELHGTKIREGDKVVMWYVSSNRDETRYEDPDRFDVTRNPEHQAFGAGGRHFCLGTALARLELRILLEETLARFPEMEIDGEPRYVVSGFVNQLKALPVRLRPAA